MIINDEYLGKLYERNSDHVKLEIGDEVIIHPIPGISMATKSYLAKIVLVKPDGCCMYNGFTLTTEDQIISIKGIRENSNWHGAWLNDYGFSRLEFVKRGALLLT